jgi:omega-6 fatty acid desaturase (delta-12 desaturase)
LFHDCTHLSLFDSKRANTIFGYIFGILTFTPYEDWRHSHVIHHASAGNLDRRDVGDVWTLTVEEYAMASKKKQLAYRLYRHPLIMFGLGPGYMFLLAHRTPSKVARKRERISVRITNLVLLGIVIIASLTIGLRTYILVQLPIILMATTAGVWLFYVQHQFEGVYWKREDVWNRIQSAMKGCSYYQLPKVLQWFTGNIGFHHIHHLRAKIPNYNLQRCYDEIPELHTVKLLTILTSLKSLRLNLWDEEQQKMVSFKDLKY